MAKNNAVYACQGCGFQSKKWLGRCTDCGQWNSFAEEIVATGKNAPAKVGASNKATNFQEISSQDAFRLSSGIAEFDRVLGGGIIPGSLILVGGDPGIGKSTLMLQAAALLSDLGHKLIYVSGEESERQIKLRGERLGLLPQNLFLLGETCLERILTEIERIKPAIVIVDSVQTIYSERLESAPSSISQVREVAGQLLIHAKQKGTAVFLIGHVTKDGMIAGPKALEHIVDTVIYFEGERHHHHRILRATKNRFGPANELGIFEMTSEGLLPVKNPSALFLQQRPLGASGSVVVACLEGTRPLLVELQALVSSSRYGTGKRMAQGVDPNRVSLLIAMLEKRTGFQLLGDDVFINVAGGIGLNEPAADLGLVAAIVSSFKNLPIEPTVAVFGEVGLAGEVRAIAHAGLRLREVSALGLKKCILPYNCLEGLEKPADLAIVGVRSVVDLIDALF